MKELIAAGADVNTGCECHGNGALHLCYLELINADVDVNIRNRTGKTALMLAEDIPCIDEERHTAFREELLN